MPPFSNVVLVADLVWPGPCWPHLLPGLSSKALWLRLGHWSQFSVTDVSSRSFGSWFLCNYFFMLMKEKKGFAKSDELRSISREVLSILENRGRNLMCFQSKSAGWWNPENGKLCSILPASKQEFKSRLFAMLISQHPWPNMARLQWEFFSRPVVKHLGSDWYSWQRVEKAGRHLAQTATNLFAVLARTLAEIGRDNTPLSLCFLVLLSEAEIRNQILFQMSSQKLNNLGIYFFPAGCAVFLLAVAKRPRFLDFWYKCSRLCEQNSLPALCSLLSWVWHLVLCSSPPPCFSSSKGIC